jgi:quercetin dioxygenase-like cupin family protein
VLKFHTNKSEVALSTGEGRSFWFLADLHTFKAVSEDTNGAYCMSEVTFTPGAPAPPHIHHHEDEAFYIVSGQFEFGLDGKTFSAGPGTLVYLPKGRVHTHGTVGTAGRALVVHTPAGLERFIAEAGTPATDLTGAAPALDMAAFERVVAIAKKYEIEVPPPA